MRPTWLDRAIGWVSPATGARRLAARRMMEGLGYEAARTGRRTEGWVTTSASADATSELVTGRLRDRARDLVRNNPLAARALEVKVANTIGTGIVAEVPNRRLRELWTAFVDECDADGFLDLYGIQALVERCRSESGEALLRFVPAEMSRSGRRVPLQVRVLEPDYLDTSRDGRTAAGDGGWIRHGIEYDPTGEAVGYWLYREHPGDRSFGSLIRPSGLESERVPADDVLHVFRRLRPGQTRGVTDFAPVMLRLRDLDDYDDAEVMRKKVEACLAAFVTSPEGADAAQLGPVSTDDEGRINRLYPAMIEYLRPGESIATAQPSSAGGYADFKRFAARDIAAGYGVPYELMTGDLSQVNYSSYRAGLVDFRRRIEQDQWGLHVPVVCDRIWRRFLREAAMILQSEAIGTRTTVEWTPPRFELIDPLKETQAELEACLAGFDSFQEIVRRRGWTAEEQLDALAEFQRAVDARGLVLKSDYRTHVTPAAAAEAEDDGDDQEAAA